MGFQATVELIGERAIVRLPADASADLPSRGQVAATVTLDGHAFDTVVEPDGERGHWVAIDPKRWRGLKLEDGDDVTLEVEPTKEWPEPTMPEDLETALAEAPDVAEPWEDITPMARWERVRWINATKSPTTRERRVEVSISSPGWRRRRRSARSSTGSRRSAGR